MHILHQHHCCAASLRPDFAHRLVNPPTERLDAVFVRPDRIVQAQHLVACLRRAAAQHDALDEAFNRVTDHQIIDPPPRGEGGDDQAMLQPRQAGHDGPLVRGVGEGDAWSPDPVEPAF